ncbi:UDP-N-acetylmuramate dehydrogenase [Desulfolithobacter sp.]
MKPGERWEFAAFWSGRVLWDVSMARYSTLRTGGVAEALVTVTHLAELKKLLAWLEERRIPWRVVGRGSNILVRSEGFAGVIIQLQGEFNHVVRLEESVEMGSDPVLVRAGAGCPLARLVAWCTNHALGGMEFMAGIPGSVGGAVRMNAGAWGRAMADSLHSITLIDRSGRVMEVDQSGMRPGYRRMELVQASFDDLIVVAATVVLKRGHQRQILHNCRENIKKRREKQPANMASAGSFFKNPEGDSAGRLIDAAGLKGLRHGQAMISPDHANFLVNTGDATPEDILSLAGEVRQRVYQKFGIWLEPEVHII